MNKESYHVQLSHFLYSNNEAVVMDKPTAINTAQEQARRGSKQGRNRNKPCICGSGIKFKVCCWESWG